MGFEDEINIFCRNDIINVVFFTEYISDGDVTCDVF